MTYPGLELLLGDKIVNSGICGCSINPDAIRHEPFRTVFVQAVCSCFTAALYDRQLMFFCAGRLWRIVCDQGGEGVP